MGVSAHHSRRRGFHPGVLQYQPEGFPNILRPTRRREALPFNSEATSFHAAIRHGMSSNNCRTFAQFPTDILRKSRADTNKSACHPKTKFTPCRVHPNLTPSPHLESGRSTLSFVDKFVTDVLDLVADELRRVINVDLVAIHVVFVEDFILSRKMTFKDGRVAALRRWRGTKDGWRTNGVEARGPNL